MNFRALRDWLADIAHAAVCIPSSKPCSRMVPVHGPAMRDYFAEAKPSVNATTPLFEAVRNNTIQRRALIRTDLGYIEDDFAEWDRELMWEES